MKACYDKVAAEERLKTLMLDYKDQLAKLQKKVEKVKPGMTSAKSGAAPSVMAGYQVAVPQTPRSATTSWAQVTPPHSPELNEMFELMTEDEKKELTNRLRQRREVHSGVGHGDWTLHISNEQSLHDCRGDQPGLREPASSTSSSRSIDGEHLAPCQQ